MKKKILFIIFLLIFGFVSVLPAFGQSENGGYASDIFSNFTAGAHASAMGDAFTACQGKAICPYWNPAGLSGIYFNEGSLTNINLFAGAQYTAAAIAYPFGRRNVLAVNITRLISGQAERTDSLGDSLGYSFREISGVYLISYSRKLSENVSAGASIRNIYREIDTYYAGGYGFDAGMLLSYYDNTTYGIALQSIPGIQAGEDKVNMSLKCGLVHSFIKDKAVLSLDLGSLDLFVKNRVKWAAGFEYQAVNNLWLRAGANDREIAAGFGVTSKSVDCDYSLGLNPLGLLHKVTVNFRYGFLPTEQEKELKKQEVELLKDKADFINESNTKKEQMKKEMKELKYRNWINARMRVAEDYFKNSNYKASEEIINQILQKDPENPDAKYLLQEIYLRSKGTYIAAKYMESLELYKQQKYNDALARINAVLSLVPQHEKAQVVSLLCRAQLDIIDRKYLQAKSKLMEVLTLDVENNEASSLLRRLQGIIDINEEK